MTTAKIIVEAEARGFDTVNSKVKNLGNEFKNTALAAASAEKQLSMLEQLAINGAKANDKFAASTDKVTASSKNNEAAAKARGIELKQSIELGKLNSNVYQTLSTVIDRNNKVTGINVLTLKTFAQEGQVATKVINNMVAATKEQIKANVLNSEASAASMAMLGTGQNNLNVFQKANAWLGETSLKLNNIRWSLVNIGFTVGAVVAPFALMIKYASDWEMQLRKIQALSEGTITPENFKGLTEFFQTTRRGTPFSTQESSASVIEFTKAGYSVEQAMKALPDIMDLAAAGFTDLGNAAQYVAATLHEFSNEGLTTKDVASTIAKAANESALDVDTFSNSLAYVGPIAAQLGISFRETSAALVILSNAGMTGSKAGTTLRQVLNSMIDPSEKAKSTMEDLGITWYDAAGNIKPLEQSMSELFNILNKYDKEGQAKILGDLFEIRGMSGVASFLNFIQSSRTGIKDTTAGLYDLNYASNIAAVNYESAATKMKDAAENLKESFKGLSTSIMNWIIPLLEGLSKILVGLDEVNKKSGGAVTKGLVTTAAVGATTIGVNMAKTALQNRGATPTTPLYVMDVSNIGKAVEGVTGISKYVANALEASAIGTATYSAYAVSSSTKLLTTSTNTALAMKIGADAFSAEAVAAASEMIVAEEALAAAQGVFVSKLLTIATTMSLIAVTLGGIYLIFKSIQEQGDKLGRTENAGQVLGKTPEEQAKITKYALENPQSSSGTIPMGNLGLTITLKDLKLSDLNMPENIQFVDKIEETIKQPYISQSELLDSLKKDYEAYSKFATERIRIINDEMQRLNKRIDGHKQAIQELLNVNFAGETGKQRQNLQLQQEINMQKLKILEMGDAAEDTDKKLKTMKDEYKSWVDTIHEFVRAALEEGNNLGKDVTGIVKKFQTLGLGMSLFETTTTKKESPEEARLKELERQLQISQLQYTTTYGYMREDLKLWYDEQTNGLGNAYVNQEQVKVAILDHKDAMQELQNEYSVFNAESNSVNETMKNFQLNIFLATNELPLMKESGLDALSALRKEGDKLNDTITKTLSLLDIGIKKTGGSRTSGSTTIKGITVQKETVAALNKIGETPKSITDSANAGDLVNRLRQGYVPPTASPEVTVVKDVLSDALNYLKTIDNTGKSIIDIGNVLNKPILAPKMNDFVMRPGQAPVSFSSDDTLIGTKSGLSNNITFGNIIIQGGTNVSIQELQYRFAQIVQKELASVRAR